MEHTDKPVPFLEHNEHNLLLASQLHMVLGKDILIIEYILLKKKLV